MSFEEETWIQNQKASDVMGSKLKTCFNTPRLLKLEYLAPYICITLSRWYEVLVSSLARLLGYRQFRRKKKKCSAKLMKYMDGRPLGVHE